MSALKGIDRRHFLKQLSLTSLALVPGVNVLAALVDTIGQGAEAAGDALDRSFIDAAYRLMRYECMLELEFYFINVRRDGKVLRPFSEQDSRFRSYMVVRLPQQHITEQYADATCIKEKGSDGQLKESRISGYSYLCFQIDFGQIPELKVDAAAFMDWNAGHFSLISKPDDEIRPFIISKNEASGNYRKDIYPLSFEGPAYRRRAYPNQRRYSKGLREESSADRSRAARVRDGAPFTALELPYRLILSPRLPSWEYDYHWIFTSFAGHQDDWRPAAEPQELWMATLTLRKQNAQIVNANKPKNNEDVRSLADDAADAPQGTEAIVNQAENQLQLMILGPSGDGLSAILPQTLPNAKDREDLTTLFNDFNLTASAPSIAFTPMGVCTHIAFRNKYFERDNISLYEWKQAISFGRDQEVEVSNVVMDRTFGLKMLHVRTTRRETNGGRALLIYREFLMPLDREKDFASFDRKEEATGFQTDTYKYNTPFQKVAFGDMHPRQILPLSQMKNTSEAVSRVAPGMNTKLQRSAGERIGRQLICKSNDDGSDVLAFWATAPDRRLLEWPMVFTDWLGQEIKLRRRLFILKSELHLDRINGDTVAVFPMDGVGGLQQMKISLPKDGAEMKSFSEIKNSIDAVLAHAGAPNAVHPVWISILKKGEDISLQHINILREHFRYGLNRIEGILRTESTRGERDIEELVMEEWQLFKRKALGVEATIESDYYELIQQIEAIGASSADTRRSLLAFLEGISRRLDPDYLRAQAVEGLRASLADLKTKSSTVVSNLMDVKDYAERKIKELESASQRALGFMHELETFWQQLPNAYTALISAVKDEIKKAGDYYAHIRHLEANLKSRIDGAQAGICYAIHQAEDEMETLKAALDKKWAETAAATGVEVRRLDQWIKDYQNLSRDFGEAVNGRLATMRTDFLLFRGSLLQAKEKKVLDFFHAYASYPQLHTAQVYMGAINDLVHRDIPLKIKYAEDYIKNQLDNYALELKNNATRVFAEVHHEAQEWLKGAMREAGRELGGVVNPELAAHYITFLKDKSAHAQQAVDDFKNLGDEFKNDLEQRRDELLSTANEDLNNLLRDARKELEPYKEQYEAYRKQIAGLRSQMLTITRDAKEQLRAAAQDVKLQAEAFFKGLEARILGAIRIKDLLGEDFNLPKLIRLKDKITYEFITKKFKPFDAKVFRFIPANLKGEPAGLVAYLEIPTRNPGGFQSRTRLENFTLGIFQDRLLVEFKQLELRSDKDVKNKVSTRLGDIKFGKELGFLSKLSGGFKLPGTGIMVKPSLTNISISYALAIPGISGGAFTFDNLKFVVGAVIPLPTGIAGKNEPIAILLGINSAIDQFAVGVLIFGGKGFFQIETTPKYIRKVDAGITFGGLFRINLVIASGEAFLQAGIRYVYERTALGESKMELYALITCGANVTVFGFIDVSVVFTMYLKYQKDSAGSSLYGVASVSYSVRIGFFSKSFTLTFSKRISGTDRSDSGAFYEPHANPFLPEDERRPRNSREEELHLAADGTWQSHQPDMGYHFAGGSRPLTRKERELRIAKANLVMMYSAYKLNHTTP